jgi:pimeloyl-ACP methyl ester carboxylesterase
LLACGSSAEPPADGSIDTTDTGTVDAFVPDDVGSIDASVPFVECRVAIPPDSVEGADVRCVDLRDARALPEILVHAIVFDADLAGTPVYVLDGGPGLRGTAYVRSLDRETRRARFGERPIVYVEQRGKGASLPRLACASGDLVFCANQARTDGIDLTRFGVTDAADDVVAIASSLGHERILLAGGSFGSRLALEVIRRHPERIEAAYLESLVPPDLAYLANFVRGTGLALDALAERCAADPTCEGDVAVDLERALARAEESPLTSSFGPITPSIVSIAIVEAQYHQDLLGRIPSGLRALAEGTPDASSFVRSALSRPPPVDSLLQFVVLCRDIAPLFDRTDFDAAIAELGPPLGPLLEPYGSSFDVCAELGIPAGPAEARTPVTTDVPLLLVAPELDARTPRVNAERVAETASNARLFDLPGRTHTPGLALQAEGRFLDACAADVLRTFLDDPDAALPSCERAIVFE